MREQKVEISQEKRAKAQQDILAVLRRKWESSKWEYYKPSPKQEEFHVHRARCRGLITANQFGKTTAGVLEAIWHAQGDHPYDERWNKEVTPDCTPNVGWVVALDRTNLADQVIIPEFKHWMQEGRWVWIPSDYKFTDNRTGSEIWIKSADSGREKFQGPKYIGHG